MKETKIQQNLRLFFLMFWHGYPVALEAGFQGLDLADASTGLRRRIDGGSTMRRRRPDNASTVNGRAYAYACTFLFICPGAA